MSFQRVSDAAVLEPVLVFGPFEQERESRNVVTPLLESDATTVAYFPAVRRGGEFQTLFATYQAAHEARDYFTVPSLYDFFGPATTPGEYIVSGGRIVLSSGFADPSFSLRFAVASGALTVTQNAADVWELRVPYREVPA